MFIQNFSCSSKIVFNVEAFVISLFRRLLWLSLPYVTKKHEPLRPSHFKPTQPFSFGISLAESQPTVSITASSLLHLQSSSSRNRLTNQDSERSLRTTMDSYVPDLGPVDRSTALQRSAYPNPSDSRIEHDEERCSTTTAKQTSLSQNYRDAKPYQPVGQQSRDVSYGQMATDQPRSLAESTWMSQRKPRFQSKHQQGGDNFRDRNAMEQENNTMKGMEQDVYAADREDYQAQRLKKKKLDQESFLSFEYDNYNGPRSPSKYAHGKGDKYRPVPRVSSRSPKARQTTSPRARTTAYTTPQRRVRPETTNAVARRIIANGLGLRLPPRSTSTELESEETSPQ